jgi:hypothetical protein
MWERNVMEGRGVYVRVEMSETLLKVLPVSRSRDHDALGRRAALKAGLIVVVGPCMGE